MPAEVGRVRISAFANETNWPVYSGSSDTGEDDPRPAYGEA